MNVAGKRWTFEVCLQRMDQVSYVRYKEKRNTVKRVTLETNVTVNERWFRKLKNLMKNNILF